jgi:hypothetical protein
MMVSKYILFIQILHAKVCIPDSQVPSSIPSFIYLKSYRAVQSIEYLQHIIVLKKNCKNYMLQVGQRENIRKSIPHSRSVTCVISLDKFVVFDYNSLSSMTLFGQL